MRTVEWGHWALRLIKAGVVLHTREHGGHDGTLGSPERRAYELIARRWREEGIALTFAEARADVP